MSGWEADLQRKFYEAVRGGMDYHEAFDTILDAGYAEWSYGMLKSWENGEPLNEQVEIEEPRRWHELDEKNYTITLIESNDDNIIDMNIPIE
jgi:hypothetical protein